MLLQLCSVPALETGRMRFVCRTVNTGGCDNTTTGLTCVVAETLSLLSPPVEPDAEAHENDPTGPSDSGNKGGLLHHIGDLFGDAVVSVSVYNHIPKLFTWGNGGKKNKLY